jgi:hypothetical protein
MDGAVRHAGLTPATGADVAMNWKWENLLVASTKFRFMN